ncbi:type I polyketide synthase [Legionella maioricensis]|uniref:SDR family NAD(P)-dependent oxidoreductase n=1 Tax=Legionella maioricensis TaxID=2896528 RepID=A0A9X2CY62_9GAMM|nr:type I polyketide synthase [Legionella maioricensis]MCL9683049.1 SDR family NAD(P)-dependent oxidoreductase [Legionella maioricensis]MCL9686397.1 SDR family NAD(P)-dependent oxidoreductase [Legionella maioricensis]
MKSSEASETLISILSTNAELSPSKTIYTFLAENKESVNITNQKLLQKVMESATRLLTLTKTASRAIILLGPGLDYIIAFLGCLMAGVIAVPAYPPRNNRHAKRLLAVINDSKAEVVITTAAIVRQYPLDRVKMLLVDEALPIDADCGRFPVLTSDRLAFLQYTSGSTGVPKGVMVSHGNIIANITLIDTLIEGSCQTVCSWLPPFHDMGLIGAILYPLVQNVHSILMAPTTFLKCPFFWLKTISDYKVDISPAPNFAYEMCVNTITEEEKKELDLSSWMIALNGSEPVNAKTLHQFTEKFSSCGFHAETFYPAYGMAETTLMVSGKKPGDNTVILDVDKQVLLESHKIHVDKTAKSRVSIVGCGYTAAEHEVKIINPQTQQILDAYEIGEVVIAGPSITQGYWEKPEASEQMFGLKLPHSNKRFLRTGDLGFLDATGQLFITGRLKDLMIIRGQNIYPQDIEYVVYESHPALIRHGASAFLMEIEDEPALVIIQEVHRRAKDFDAIFAAILRRCSEDLAVVPAKIILIPQATLLKTSSGKVQRNACRDAMLNNELTVIAQWQKVTKQAPQHPVDVKENDLQTWMSQWFANRLNLNLQQIDSKANFAYYGVDSSLAMQFCAALEQYLQCDINPSLLWSYSTIEQLANYLSPAPFVQNETPLVQSQESKKQQMEPIAIIGMSCRFPGGINTPEQLWSFLQEGKEGIRQVPADRWNAELYYDPVPNTPGKMVTDRGGFIDHIDQFDAALFNISPREAEAMDPQHRLLLELSWEALEHAGIAPSSLNNSDSGVFVGISSDDYSRLATDAVYQYADAYYGLGNAHSAASGRIAYFLGSQGPNETVDTACSSSLVAVFNACQELQSRMCHVAIAGGVNSILEPSISISFSQAGMLSPSGKCQVFDANADGYVRSEGCGVLILKRLTDAQRDGDKILAVIQSAVVNSDGHSNGITAPSPQAQKELIETALNQAGLSADAISYIEAHGTGTRLGDPIEFNALREVFATGTRQKVLYVGSVKSNLGHLEAAAGMAGLMKTILMLQHKQIPANVHLKNVNPLINLDSIPAQVPTQLQRWETTSAQTIRYAGVSSFGFTGTNAHLILAEAQPDEKEKTVTPQRPWHVLTLSGHTLDALKTQRTNILNLLRQEMKPELANLCHTLNVGRSALAYRLVVGAKTIEDMIRQLEAYPIEAEPRPITHKQCAFLFTGQGAQYSGMGLELYTSHPLFKAQVDNCCRLLADYLPVPLDEVMFNPEKNYLLQQTQYNQPALFVLQYAMAMLWINWGVKPTAVIGHSVGEYVAATVAGMMRLEDGLKLIFWRGKLMQAQKKGSMIAVKTSSELALQLLNEVKQESATSILNIAAINSPSQIVFSGESELISQLEKSCQLRGIAITKLAVSHAFHSELMRPMLDEFREIADTIQYMPAKMLFISNVTGKAMSSVTGSYWVNHVLATVQFNDGINQLFEENYQIFIEVGPQPILLSFAMVRNPAPAQALWLASLKKNSSDWETLADSIGQLYSHGVDINWSAFDAPFQIEHYSKPLPTYPFQRQSYWLAKESHHQETVLLDAFINQALYQIYWKKLPSTGEGSIEQQAGSWLIFVNQNAESSKIANVLSEHLAESVIVKAGSAYKASPSIVILNPFDPEHFLRLLANLPDLAGIVYLWGMTDSDFVKTDKTSTIITEVLTQYISEACAGLLHLTQALIHKGGTAKLRVVTRATAGFSQSSIPVFTPLIGMSKTLVLEFPQLDYQHIDFDADATVKEVSTQLRPLLATHCETPLLVSYKSDLYVPRLRHAKLKHANAEWRSDSTCLITGGLGGLGLTLCKWLIKQGIKHIVLLGRRPLTTELDEQLKALSGGNQTISYLQADVSDMEQLRTALSLVQSSLPTIKSIFHTAGILSDGLWQNLSWAQFEEVFRAKIQGAWNLHQLSIDLALDVDYFVLFSSISALLGSPGQANYAAANAFLDGLAHYRQQSKLAALSINFGPWQQLGMTRDLPQSWLSYGIKNISEKEGMAALRAMMASPSSQLCLMPNRMSSEILAQLPSFHRTFWSEAIQSGFSAESTNSSSAPDHVLSQLKNASERERVAFLTELVTKEIKTVLRLKENQPLAMHTTLLALGMDSLIAVELLHQLKSKLPVANLSAQTLLLENHSIHELIKILDEMIKKSLNEIATTSPELPIAKRNLHQFNQLLPLSVQQIRIWRHIQEQPDNPAYRITSFLEIIGSLDVDALEQSIRQVIKRHAMLRCSFHTYLNTTFQFCHDEVHFKLQFLDLSQATASQQKLRINQVVAEVSQHQFDVTKAPLLESRLIKCTEKQHIWTLSLSHLLIDGASSLILLQDILHYYALNLKTTTEALDEEAVPYQAFIDWQLASFVNGSCQKYTAFWQEKLQNYKPIPLPTDKAIPEQALAVGSRELIDIAPEDLETLQKLAKEHQLTLVNLLLAAYGLLLARFAQTDRAFITMLCSGRELEPYRTTVGNVANELPLIISFAPDATFFSMVKQLQDDLVNSLDYQYFQPEQITELGLPVPDVSFDFQHLCLPEMDTGFTLRPFSLKQVDLPLWGANPRKLSLKFNYTNVLSGYIKYRRDLYEEETIKRLAKQYVMTLKQIMGNPEIKCRDIIIAFPGDKL